MNGQVIGEEPLGRLGGIFFKTTTEIKTVRIPEDAVPGQTSYIVVEADAAEEFSELDEDFFFIFSSDGQAVITGEDA